MAKKNLWCKRKINIWHVNVDNIVISKLVEAKTNSKHLIGYLDQVTKPLVLVLVKKNIRKILNHLD